MIIIGVAFPKSVVWFALKVAFFKYFLYSLTAYYDFGKVTSAAGKNINFSSVTRPDSNNPILNINLSTIKSQ